MASDDVLLTTEEEEPLFTNPWPALITGLVAGVLGALLLKIEGDSWILPGLIVLGVGLLATGVGVAIAPRAPIVLGLAAFISLLAAVSAHPRWDSAGLLLFIMSGVAATGALVVMLPQWARRAVVSAAILFHFGGILTAVMSPDPSPLIINQMWTHIFRPYLQFMYLNNAYHFYSPDPGPAEQLWFRVSYTDPEGNGHGYWLRVPNRDSHAWFDPLYHEYQRSLALTESTHQMRPSPSIDQGELERRRWPTAEKIWFHPELLPNEQYQQPAQLSEKMLASYARHVWTTMEGDHPDWQISGIKIYRAEHRILFPRNFSDDPKLRMHPDSPWLFLPYYQGEFDRNGHLKDPVDPLLYWVIPIIRVPKNQPKEQPKGPAWFRKPLFGQAEEDEDLDADQYKVLNFLKIHSGDTTAEDQLPPLEGEWK